ncbi:SHOCT domain-containing protein [Catellatospora sp. NPDC049111]|uniref:SHOCT domain-containing protein n=1 Tax=Catellatospora sp. NPDC049111 TaxID=3155271 RepID=UPI0033DD5591
MGEEVRGRAPVGRTTPEDPVVLLEKPHRLKQAGALSDAEYEAQKARILGA